jgi:MarR family transcriptional regulator, lower aerobic nicotinate degradation pathway regulator
MKTKLAHTLIDQLDEFSKSNNSENIEDFAIWLSGKYFKSDDVTNHKEHLDLMLAFQISMLNKEIKKQTKSVISDSPLSSLDGYSFLLHLEQVDSFRKMEIIEMHNLEAPTGIEVIKRLIAKGLIEEFDDQEDKRAKRVKLTEKGQKELIKLKPQIDIEFSKFSKPLTLEEKLGLVSTMNKLI